MKNEFNKILNEAMRQHEALHKKDMYADCIKCGMTGLKSKMKEEDKIALDGTCTIDGVMSIGGRSTVTVRSNKKVVTEYTCIHCQPKVNKKK